MATSDETKPREGRLRRWGRDLAIFALVLLAVQWFQTRSLVRGGPPLVGTTTAGSRYDLHAHRGRPVLVHFFATWCGVCKAEEGSVRSVDEDHEVVWVASRSGSTAAVARYVREHGLRGPVVLDETGALARAFGVRAFPSSFFLDSRGEVDFATVGYTTEIGMRARLALSF